MQVNVFLSIEHFYAIASKFNLGWDTTGAARR